jgi:hypothetical protein
MPRHPYSCRINILLDKFRVRSVGALPRATILAEWLRYFNDLAVGETAAPACFLRENAKGGRNAPAAKSLK